MRWMSSFLKGHTQCVYIESDMSSFLPVSSGVPQGSVLGLLLFVNDLPDSLVSPVGVKIFSDDTKLYFAHGDCDTTTFSNSLSHFCSWSTRWQHQFSKSNVTCISFENLSFESIDFSQCGIVLDVVNSIGNIRVYLTSDLKPRTQCSYIAVYAWSLSSPS